MNHEQNVMGALGGGLMEWIIRPDDWKRELTPEQESYEKMLYANARAHCAFCGRFIRASTFRRVYNGPNDDTWTWFCSACGICHD